VEGAIPAQFQRPFPLLVLPPVARQCYPFYEEAKPMPMVRDPSVLKAVYLEAARLINERSIPTEILSAPRTVFRYFSRDYVNLRSDGVFSKHLANQALVVRDSGARTASAVPPASRAFRSGVVFIVPCSSRPRSTSCYTTRAKKRSIRKW
jgi:hypothetical protein